MLIFCKDSIKEKFVFKDTHLGSASPTFVLSLSLHISVLELAHGMGIGLNAHLKSIETICNTHLAHLNQLLKTLLPGCNPDWRLNVWLVLPLSQKNLKRKINKNFKILNKKLFSFAKISVLFFVRQFVRYFFMTLCWKKYQIFSFSLIPKYVCNVFILVQVIDVSCNAQTFVTVYFFKHYLMIKITVKFWFWQKLKVLTTLNLHIPKKENVFHIKIRFKTYLKTCWRYCQILQNLLSAFSEMLF